MRSRLPWIIVLAAVFAALGLWLGAKVAQAPRGDGPKTALVYPAAREIPPFELERADGGKLANADLQGAWTLLFFGYTHCPDVCPTTLGTMKQVEALLAKDPAAAPVNVVFVSVDPERDTAKALSEYVGYFSKRFVAATADNATLQSLASAVGVVFIKSPQAGGDYTMDHTASLLVVDPQARLHALFRPPFDAGAIAEDLRTLAKENPR